MYWRVQKISVEQLAKTYGIYLVCIISVFVNAFFIFKMKSAPKLAAQQQQDYTAFATEVAKHWYDGGFLTFADSMTKLKFNGNKSELYSTVINAYAAKLPKSMEEVEAMRRKMESTKNVCQVCIDSVKVDEPKDNGQVPIEVDGRVVGASAGDVFGPEPFRLQILVAMASVKTASSGSQAEAPRSKFSHITDLTPKDAAEELVMKVVDLQELGPAPPQQR